MRWWFESNEMSALHMNSQFNLWMNHPVKYPFVYCSYFDNANNFSAFMITLCYFDWPRCKNILYSSWPNWDAKERRTNRKREKERCEKVNEKSQFNDRLHISKKDYTSSQWIWKEFSIWKRNCVIFGFIHCHPNEHNIELRIDNSFRVALILVLL